MAGRGCTITITILPSTVNDDPNIIDQTQEINLPVALHSPLEILRDQIERLTSIIVTDQVLILCDLTDPERNSDILLDGRNHMSLRECGIRNGSNLTLHALGLSAEKRMKLLKEAYHKKSILKTKIEEPSLVLNTKISAADANHSYNGVIFDIEVTGPHEVEINSISLAGMLGPLCIYARDREWAIDNEDEPSPHWWAHRESISQTGWALVAKVDCLPSWDKPYEIMFDKPFRMFPHSKHGFYCHSSLPDDLGIQYQSYQANDVIAEDSVLKLHPGLGHTGSEPFDNHHGWYRAYRGLAGKVSYRAKIKGWTVDEHDLFPVELKNGVKTMLLAHYHNECQQQEKGSNRNNNDNDSNQQIQQSKLRRLEMHNHNNDKINDDLDIDVDTDNNVPSNTMSTTSSSGGSGGGDNENDDLPALLDLYTASGKRNKCEISNTNAPKDSTNSKNMNIHSNYDNDNHTTDDTNSSYATTVESTTTLSSPLSSSSFSSCSSSSSSSSSSVPPPALSLSVPASPRSSAAALISSLKQSMTNRLTPTAAAAAATAAQFVRRPFRSSSSSSSSTPRLSSIDKSHHDNNNDEDDAMRMISTVSSKSNKSNFHYNLPKFIIYNIMEFMHWDWFADTRITKSPFTTSASAAMSASGRRLGSMNPLHSLTTATTAGGGGGTAGGGVANTNGFEIMNLIQMLGLQHEMTFFQPSNNHYHHTVGDDDNGDDDDDEYDPDEEEEIDEEEDLEEEEEEDAEEEEEDEEGSTHVGLIHDDDDDDDDDENLDEN